MIISGLLLVVAVPTAVAQQWRQGGDLGGNRQSRMAAPDVSPIGIPAQNIDDQEATRRERKIRWLKSANGTLGSDVDNPANGSRGRMTGMSREERFRLRSDIRQAGYSAYSPDSNFPRDQLPVQSQSLRDGR